jgi:hypothetical protein
MICVLISKVRVTLLSCRYLLKDKVDNISAGKWMVQCWNDRMSRNQVGAIDTSDVHRTETLIYKSKSVRHSMNQYKFKPLHHKVVCTQWTTLRRPVCTLNTACVMCVPDPCIVDVCCHHLFPFCQAEETHKCEGGHDVRHEGKVVKKEPL